MPNKENGVKSIEETIAQLQEEVKRLSERNLPDQQAKQK
jgi:uncharacterized small protein (DUF1192 family)